MYRYRSDSIAVVSMGGVFPDAPNLDEFWRNIISNKVSIQQLPNEIFKSYVHCNPQSIHQTEKHDKSYTKMGCHTNPGYFAEIAGKYRILPAVSEHMDEGQHAILYSVDQALERMNNKHLPREKTAIILGNTMVCKGMEQSQRRVIFREFEFELINNPDLKSRFTPRELERIAERMSDTILHGNPDITEDTAPGQIPNLVAGRVASVFDFWGPAFTVDAACASGLAAVMCGIDGLVSGEYDAVISGAVDLQVGSLGLILFSAINALSPDGSFPFDARANGFVIGSGAGVVVLKRFEDALRDEDNIMAIISGRARGSDGKGKYIAAPNEDGQIRVIVNAMQKAGYPVDTIEMIEAHGTGTPVGDVAEINALKRAFEQLGVAKKEYCNLSSVKSNVGHLKSAAGAAGMVKAVLSLYNKTLPPTANLANLNPKLQLKGSPFYVATERMPWHESKNHPRRANVSSFGFGGADYHLALEEFRPEFVPKLFSSANLPESIVDTNQPGETSASPENIQVVFLSGDSVQELELYFDRLMKMIDENGLYAAIFHNNSNASVHKNIRAAIVAHNKTELASRWSDLVHYLNGKQNQGSTIPLRGIYVCDKAQVKTGNIAVMFPGQGSQYPNMLKEVYQECPASKMIYDIADAYWNENYGHKVTSLIFGNDETNTEQVLKKTENTHPAVFVSSLALYKTLEMLGLRARFMIGHSLGEITALCAAGGMNLKDALKLVDARGHSFLKVDDNKTGILMSVSGDEESVNLLIDESGQDIYICNINASNQVVVGGLVDDIEKFREFLAAKGIAAVILKVSHAFHSPLVNEAAEDFFDNIQGLHFEAPGTQVFANHLSRPYGEENLENMPYHLKEQLLNPVRFAESILCLYESGVRLFVEVGPGSVLSNLVKDILKDKEDFIVLTTNLKSRDSMDQLHHALGELFTLGVEIQTFLPAEQLQVSHSTDARNIRPADTNILEDALCYSGVSIGLPGSFKEAFRDDNFEQIFEGRNMIERLTEIERKNMLDLNITRLVKNEAGASFERLSQLNEVIQLAGKIGKIDMLGNYKISEDMLVQMTENQCLAIAAGYEALADAGIPLVEDLNRISGRNLEQRLLLPEEMRETTGVIFASSFPHIEPFIQEVSRHIAYKYGSKIRTELIDFYQTIISRIQDVNTQKMLSDWFAVNYSMLSDMSGVSDVYSFSNTFIMQFAALANCRMAQLIGAQGPNFQISGACSSTAYALAAAESLIKTGAADRMIIVGSENATQTQNFPYIAAGFLSAGTVTTKSDLYEAALPFDARRNGMIIGAGAIGIILEKESQVSERGMNAICRLMGSHSFNMAGHPTRLDTGKYSRELEKFIRRMEEKYNIDRRDLARSSAYFSHETYTPREGGCSQTEKESLELTFGPHFQDIIVCNTKGFTGHTMGVSIEDAIAAKALQYQTVPPIANYRVEDPMLAGLNLSKGGRHQFDYALRMVAGFGGQGNYILLKKIAHGDQRITDMEKNSKWLRKLSGSNHASLKKDGRLLRLVGTQTGIVQTKPDDIKQNDISKKSLHPLANPADQDGRLRDAIDEILNIIGDITRYPKDMLELDMEMEADLGIDTVKQATIFSRIMEYFQFSEDHFVHLSAAKTIGSIIELVQSMMTDIAGGKAEIELNRESGSFKLTADPMNRMDPKSNSIIDTILTIVSEITKYPTDMLELDMEMEADLGIDTVKQATIFSKLFEKYEISPEEGSRLSAGLTISKLIDFINMATGQSLVEESLDKSAEPSGEVERPHEQNTFGTANVSDVVMSVFAEILDHPIEMLDADLELEADLYITPEKTKRIFSTLENRFGLERNDRQFETIGDVIKWIESSPIAEDHIDLDALAWQYPVLIHKELESEPVDLQDRHVWVIGDDEVTVDKIAAKIAAKTLVKYIFEVNPNEPALDNLMKNPVDIVIDCTHIFNLHDFNQESRNARQDLLHQSGYARFALYKKLASLGGLQQTQIIAVISTDGGFGYSSSNPPGFIDPSFGAVSGLYKGLRKEFPNTGVKIIDVSSGYLVSPCADLIDLIHKELGSQDGDYEIGYIGNERFVVRIDELDRANYRGFDLNQDLHYLIAGGASGISSEITSYLAKSPHNRITLIGRSSLEGDFDRYDWMNDSKEEDIFRNIKEEMQKNGEKPTPSSIRKRIETIQKTVAIKGFVSQLKQDGANVQYYCCDVLDGEKLISTMEEAVGKYGPIDILINGTGYEKSSYLQNKTDEEFRQVFDTKVYGTYNLLDACSSSKLKSVILFSSISGRFGNEAQVDYCAANAFLNLLAKSYKLAHPDCHIVSVDWSGWKDVGMAWRNEIIRHSSEEFGINLIEPSRGVAALSNILTRDYGIHEIIISKGLSNIFGHNHFLLGMSNTPLLEWATRRDGKITRVHKIFTVRRDALIAQHKMGVIPILPAAASMELCAEFYVLMEGLKNSYSLNDLHFPNPFKLFRGEPRELYLEGEKIDNSWDIKIKSKFKPRNIEHVSTVLHANMKVSDYLNPNYRDMHPDTWAWTKRTDMKELSKMKLFKKLIDVSEYRDSIKIGPLYLRLVEGELDICRECDEGIILPVLFPVEQLNNRHYPLANLVINPCFIDTIYQGGSVDLIISEDNPYLPWSIEEVGVLKVPREDRLFWVYGQRVSLSDTVRSYHVSILDQHGDLVCYARNASFKAL